jgi:hypothetical protein
MKKLISILCLLYLCASCSTGKQTITVQSLKIKLPKEAIKIDKTSLDPSTKRNQRIIELDKLKNIYKINDVYLAMNTPFKGAVKKDLLINYKKFNDYQIKDFKKLDAKERDRILSVILAEEVNQTQYSNGQTMKPQSTPCKK